MANVSQQIAIPTGTSSGANYTPSTPGQGVMAASSFKQVAVQLISTSLDQADGVIQLQDSIDGANWNNISGATITVGSGTNSNMIRYTAFTGNFLRAIWTKGSNTAVGTLYAIALFKD